MKKTPTHPLPRKIWFLWLQGYDDMPPLVQKCHQSWRQCNPDWEFTFLDEHNIYDYIDVKKLLENREAKIYRVSQSEIIRINLLKKYGGVWVDATCFCQQALDQWLFAYLDSGFFAFHRPGIDRMFSSWFLAAVKENELVNVYCQAVNQFWPANKNIKLWVDRPLLKRLLVKFKIHGYLKRHPKLWYHPIFVKGFKIYPYFWFFYLFEKCYHENQSVQRIWDQTTKLSADIPHKIQHFGLFKPITKNLKKDIDQKVDPLYKLTFKFDAKELKPGTALDYLLSTCQLPA